jgi:signal transduction histidine kinase
MRSNLPARILIVDDDPRNLDALESFLQSPDCQLVRAQTAEQALHELLDGEFAVIVLDVRMPGMTGIELANLIKRRKRTQHIPIIFLTAYLQEDKDALEGYGIGAVDYLTKPINPQILKSKIGVFVDLFRKTRALASTNAALELEIVQRQKAEDALRRANSELEDRVKARTAELIRINDALRASEAQAMTASRAKDDFLAALSHELRTPLNPVLLLATEAAHNQRLPAETRADFETIARNVALEARLIDDLLDLTRITHGKLALEMQPVDIHGCLQEVLAMIREDMEQKQLRLVLRLDARRSTVRGDDTRLKQVFWNVIKNAVKFTPVAGRIEIATAHAADAPQVTVRVTDTGIGMTATEIARAFEAFAQGDHAGSLATPQLGGLGLGLAISRMMVDLHAGSISAASDGRDRGTAITITLPLLPVEALGGLAESPPPGPLAPVARFADRPCRILLVEDHPSTAHTLSQLLVRRGYRIVVANSLAGARACAESEIFDVLISDIGLPDGTGYALMAELRQRQGLVGIAMTGYGMQKDVNRSRAAGFSIQLTKPVSMLALDRALSDVGAAQTSGRPPSPDSPG